MKKIIIIFFRVNSTRLYKIESKVNGEEVRINLILVLIAYVMVNYAHHSVQSSFPIKPV